jgi:glycosyltransferase involved in cell wall biosynthesis
MSCARPCVVANHGFSDTLGEFKNDLIYEFGDDRQLAARLARLLALPGEARDRIGVYLRNQVLALHSIEHLSKRLIALCASVRAGQEHGSAHSLNQRL